MAAQQYLIFSYAKELSPPYGHWPRVENILNIKLRKEGGRLSMHIERKKLQLGVTIIAGSGQKIFVGINQKGPQISFLKNIW